MVGVLPGLIGGGVLVSQIFDFDPGLTAVGGVVLAIGVYTCIVAVLLSRGRIVGWLLAWTILPFVLCAFPVGTGVGIWIVVNMERWRRLT